MFYVLYKRVTKTNGSCASQFRKMTCDSGSVFIIYFLIKQSFLVTFHTIHYSVVAF